MIFTHVPKMGHRRSCWTSTSPWRSKACRRKSFCTWRQRTARPNWRKVTQTRHHQRHLRRHCPHRLPILLPEVVARVLSLRNHHHHRLRKPLHPKLSHHRSKYLLLHQLRKRVSRKPLHQLRRQKRFHHLCRHLHWLAGGRRSHLRQLRRRNHSRRPSKCLQRCLTQTIRRLLHQPRQ